MSKYTVLKKLPYNFLKELDLSSGINKSHHEFDGINFFYYPEKIKCFLKQPSCIVCGMEGNVVHIEKGNGNYRTWNTEHINLYAERKTEDGLYKVLLTVDHNILKSKGGPDIVENYNTMCEYCNKKRGDKFENLQDYLNICDSPEEIIKRRSTYKKKSKLKIVVDKQTDVVERRNLIDLFVKTSCHSHVGEYNRYMKKIAKEMKAK